MSSTLELVLVLIVVAAACAVPGVFLVLRRMALVSDAISHVLLFGIVLAYFATRDLDSPWLLVGAAATGLLTVALVELLQRTQRVKEDAAIGLVFPALFALGVMLASMFFRNTHLDIDQVLLGDPTLATEPRWHVGGQALKPFIVMVVILAANVLLAVLVYKELKLTTFDAGLAASMGFRPGLMHYALMTVVSLTAVAAFDTVGPVLVVGFFVIPAMAGLLLTNRLGVLMGVAVLVASLGATAGTVLALRWDTNIAGTVAMTLGAMFALVFVLAPQYGLVADVVRRRRQKRAFHETMLTIHLLQHEDTAAEADEARIAGLHRHLLWTADRVARVVRRAERNGLVRRQGELLKLTEAGRTRARSILGERAAG